MIFNPKRAYAALSLNARICASATALAVLSLVVTEVVTASKSSSSAESASLSLARAALHQASATLQGRIGSNLAAVVNMGGVVRATKASGQPLSREQLGEISKATLLGSDDLLGAAITFEPNALDGKDADYVGQKPLYDDTGRYMPYWTRNGSSLSVEPIVFYPAPGANDWYDIPKQTGKVFFTEPYAYAVNGQQVQMASLVAPIKVDGKFIGVASADFMLNSLGAILAKLNSFEGGQLALVSNGGLYASNPDSELIGKPATDIPPEGREHVRQGKAFEYADSKGMAHMLQPLYLHPDIAPWAVKLTYPHSVVLAPARELLLYTIVVSSMCALSMAALLIILVNRLMHPLRALGAAMTGLASGDADLSVRLSVHGNDELAEIGNGFNRFMGKIQGVLVQVRRTSGSVATASTEISHGNAALSSRTEQQASSLEETAASMEELTSTVRQNAENARQASQLATSASEVALRGGGMVAAVVQTMGSINDSSKRVVDIINVIDGITFQTNILALNAAVEAARAGEQGRGFAVVASEVRNLAQRSVGAAKEIKELINASVIEVEAGSRLVVDAGRTMQEIVASISGVTSIIGEIAEASAEQSIGIAQVNQAIVEMDDVTQQNSALVEQAAAASASLRDEAAKMVALLGEFRLGENEHRGLALLSNSRTGRYAHHDSLEG